jgi:hypothetical protein
METGLIEKVSLVRCKEDARGQQNGPGSSLKEQVANAVALAKTLMKETDGWTVSKEEGNTVLSVKTCPGSSVNCARAVGPVKGKPEELIEKLWAFRKAEWQKWSDDVEEWNIIDEVDENTRVVYQVNKLPWPIWNRDACFAQAKGEDSGVHYLISFSVEHEKAPRQDQKYVRASVIIGVYAFEADGDVTKATRIIHLDPAGNIPSSLVNSKTSSVFQVIEQLNSL